MSVEIYKVAVVVIDKRALRLKRERYCKPARKGLDKSSMFVPFVECLEMGDLPSFSAHPFQGWAYSLPLRCGG